MTAAWDDADDEGKDKIVNVSVARGSHKYIDKEEEEEVENMIKESDPHKKSIDDTSANAYAKDIMLLESKRRGMKYCNKCKKDVVAASHCSDGTRHIVSLFPK